VSKNLDAVETSVPRIDGRPPRVWISLDSEREAQALRDAIVAEGWQALVAPPDAEFASSAAAGAAGWDAAVAEAGERGRALVRELARLEPPVPAILLSTFGTIGDAVEAVRAGAFDHLARPIAPAQLLVGLRRAVVQRRLAEENARLRSTLEDRISLGSFRTRDPRMQRVAEVVAAVADTRASVLIRGESGTGKSLLARTIHELSSRAKRPFVVVDCGALPASLLESELFGHARGAFTGAVRDKPGRIEAADRGTLFLDEIGNAPLDLQAKLLRVLQERVLERIGETRSRSVDVRWIAATHRDLDAAIRGGTFREDLYWRLNVVGIDLPPLRERPRDVALYAEQFAQRFAREHGRPARAIDADALALLCAAPWPGNVRELEHAVERAVLFAHGATLTAADFEADASLRLRVPAALPAADVRSLKAALAEPERRLIEGALRACGGNRERAAERLGINRSTLFNKMRKHGLTSFPRGVGTEPGHPAPPAAR
jgi:DNA-binding NtrC family response regulator